MSKPTRIRAMQPISVAIAFAAAAATLGCKGSGGGGPAPANSAAPTGAVSILIADGPAPDLDRIWIDIERVSLIPAGSGSPVIVFDGAERVDLLRHDEEDFLLATASDVPAGRYAKIRLEVSRVDVEPSSECPEVKLPSGKIDLEPRGAFEVGEASSVVVRIDIDAKKSISIHRAGKSGKCIFRPVVFVDILGAPVSCRQEVAGTIVRVLSPGDEPEDEVDLFPLQDDDNLHEGHDDEDDGDDEDEGDDDARALLAVLEVDLGAGRGTVRAVIDEETVIFDEMARPASFSVLHEGDSVKARGRMIGCNRLRLQWAIEGRPFEVLGEFTSAIAGGIFVFDSDDGTFAGRTTAATRAYGECDSPVELDRITEGVPARILGIEYAEGAETILRAAVIDLEPAEVRGEIIEVDRSGARITIRGASGDSSTITVPASAAIVLVGDGALTQEDLRPGQTVTVRLDEVFGSASRIAVEPKEASGTVQDLDVTAGTFRLAPGPGEAIQVEIARGATVLLIEDDDRIGQVDLSALTSGDEVIVFGLIPTAGRFDARTVVIRR